MTILLIVGAVAVAIVLWAVAVYNGFITLRNRVKESWSDIDVQLKRRYDLIPNLVEAVKGYTKHEDQTFAKVTEARARAMGAQTVGEKSQAEGALSGALKSLFAVAEAYPELKASENFVKLQEELTDTEDKIQAARRFYNSTVIALNNKIEHFPSNFVAAIFGFKQSQFFELGSQAERASVKVDF